MGDFLDRLAARTLGLAPVSQPIVPTFFSSAWKPGGTESEAALRTGVADVPAGKFSQVEQDVTPRLTGFPRNQSSDVFREVKAAKREPSAYDLTPPNVDASQARGDVPPVVAAPFHAKMEPLQAHPSLEQTLKVEREPSPPTNQTTVAARALAEVRPAIVPVVRRVEEPAHRDSANHGSAESHGDSKSQSHEESAAPVVRVTIGRVEVRAQFPATPSPPATGRSRVASLSLDAYSKQRAGGKR